MTEHELRQIIESRRNFTADELADLRANNPMGNCPMVGTEEQAKQLGGTLGAGVAVRSYHGTYIGAQTRLRGKTALYRYRDENHVYAQFDDRVLPEAYGWHIFEAKEFTETT